MKFLNKAFALAIMLSFIASIALSGCGSNSTPNSAESEETSYADNNLTDVIPEDAAESDTFEPVSDPEVSLEIVTSAGSWGIAIAIDSFKTAVEEASGGRVFIDSVALTGHTDESRMADCMVGVNDLAMFSCMSISGTIPNVAYLGVPFCYSYQSEDDVDSFVEFNDSMHDIMNDILEPYGLHFLAFCAPSETTLIGTFGEMLSPTDLKGQVMRVSGTWMGKLFQSLGAGAESLSQNEVATGMQRGMIDGAVSGLEQVIRNQWYEQADNVTILSGVDSLSIMAINLDVWDNLTETQQGYLEDGATSWVISTTAEHADTLSENIATLEENGVTVHYLDAESCDEWYKAVLDIYDEIDESTDESGHALRQALVDFAGGN